MQKAFGGDFRFYLTSEKEEDEARCVAPYKAFSMVFKGKKTERVTSGMKQRACCFVAFQGGMTLKYIYTVCCFYFIELALWKKRNVYARHEEIGKRICYDFVGSALTFNLLGFPLLSLYDAVADYAFGRENAVARLRARQ